MYYIYIYKTRLASNQIFSPLNKVHREVGPTTDLSAPLYKPVLLGSPGCDRCKQASEMASHAVCCFEAMATLRFKNLSLHPMKPGYFEHIFMSRILHFAQNAGLLNA